MLKLPFEKKHSLAPLSIVLVSIVFMLWEPVSSDWFAYNRLQLNEFQWWRLITGHFLHTNLMHLVLNLTGITLLWALHGHYFLNLRYWLVFLLLCLGTSVCLFVFSTNMQWYVGLSGVLHGLFVIGAYFDIRNHLKSGWLLLLGVYIKVIHEQIYGASQNISDLIAANVAIDAHLFGTLTASLLILYYFIRARFKSEDIQNDPIN